MQTSVLTIFYWYTMCYLSAVCLPSIPSVIHLILIRHMNIQIPKQEPPVYQATIDTAPPIEPTPTIKPTPEPTTVPYSVLLFNFSSSFDKFLIFTGSLFALLNAIALPLMTFLLLT